MEPWSAEKFKARFTPNPIKYKKTIMSNSVYAFDIEVSSGWINDYGYIHGFDECLNDEYYNTHEKVSLPYMAMFGYSPEPGIEWVYYVRDFKEVKEIFKIVKECEKMPWHCFVHNLSYEFVFLRNLYNDDIEAMFARSTRSIIYFNIPSAEVTMRCSYLLTNKSLSLWGSEVGIPKMVGDLDYHIWRTPNTPLSFQEFGYCEHDITIMLAGLHKYRKEYGNIGNIPLTSTGEVRRDMHAACSYSNKIKMTALQPQNMEEYRRSKYLFFGGDVHGYLEIIGKVLKDMESWDLTSDYPFHLLLKYPMTPFRKNISNKITNTDEFAYQIHLRGKSMVSKSKQHYLSSSRFTIYHGGYAKGMTCDNGRVVAITGGFECWMTELDYEIFQEMYDIEGLEIIESWYSKKNYLPKYYIEAILDYYEKKTTLKGVSSEDGSLEELYTKSKNKLNSMYGMVCTALIHEEITFDGDWQEVNRTGGDQLREILDHPYKNFGFFNIGVWCTAYARWELWKGIQAVHASGSFVAYFDTDSVKVPKNTDMSYFIKRNQEIIELGKKCLQHYKIPLERLAPKDIKGKEHPLGVWDFNDGHYSEMKVLGCKRYAYRDKKDGKLHVTVAGVPKKGGAKALHDDINRFRDGMTWDYPDINKVMPFYLDGSNGSYQREFISEGYHSTFKYGINMRPTSYTLDSHKSFEDALEYYMTKEGIINE